MLADHDTAKQLLSRATRSLIVTVDAAGRPCASTLESSARSLQVEGSAVRVVLPPGGPHAGHLERDSRMAIVAVDDRAAGGSMVLLGRASRTETTADGALELCVEHVRAGVAGWSFEDLAAWRQG